MFQNEMPTSSQAMILRGSDPNLRSQPSLSLRSPTEYRPTCDIPTVKYPEIKSPRRENCEVVKFDFSVTTSQEKSINGFQGVFAYDQKTKSYRWQICSVQPKTRAELAKNFEQSAGSGDIKTNDDVCELQKDELDESESFVKFQPSEHTQHFTTPTVSLLDNSPYSNATELHGKTTLFTSLRIPPDTEMIDENAYRRLEQLGFRRRTTYSPGGALIRLKQGTSPLRDPQKCSSDPLTAANTMTKLSIKNLDPTKVPEPKSVPFKNQGFQPKAFISRESIRKRVQPEKQKTLLEEVKECVDWENRVSPSLNRRRGKPSYIPTAICFSLKNSYNFSHSDIKNLVETQTGCKIKTLWFDPVTVRTGDPDTLDRWVVTLESREDAQKVVQIGIAIDGDHVVVREWDAILKDEYIPEEDDWNYPCNFRLQADKHNLILRNFLQKVQ